MLALNLAKIRTPHERFEREYQPDEVGASTDAYRVVAPVSVAFDVYKDKDKFRLAGRVRSTLELACSRCLEAYELPVDLSFDLRYQPHTHDRGEGKGEVEIEEDDLNTAFYENDEIDLGQLLQEQFYLALPMKPLCSDACRGLCPTCGTNLNRAPCDCQNQWEDPRLAGLRALRKES
jgi:uncharacterized protein